MDLSPILQDIQAKLAENASSVQVHREDYVPSNLTTQREAGFIAWSFSMDFFVECSTHLTGTVEGDLDVICYARPRSTRSTLHTNVLDLWLPEVEGKRTSLGPCRLANSFLHFVMIEDVSEIFSEKTGHQDAETPGIVTTFRIKIST